MLFTIPIGGGIPAGVLLAQSKGIVWPWMMILYLISDLMLAVAFEPILLLLARVASRVAFLGRVGEAFRQSLEKSAARYGHVTGPFALVMVAFGVDPKTGRAAAKAAGHGFVTGWMIAIAGDMIYFTVLMVCTLWLKTAVGDGTVVILIVFAGMMIIPAVIRRVRGIRR
jgi:hypothetical protein